MDGTENTKIVSAVVKGKIPTGGGTDRYVANWRMDTKMESSGWLYTLVLIYNDGTEMAVPLPQMGIDMDRVVQFGETDPDGNVAGATKQIYINIRTGRAWVCRQGNMHPVEWIPICASVGGKTEIIDDGETVTVKFGG